jgi:hypothetical protein
MIKIKLKLDQDSMIDSYFETVRLIGFTAPLPSHFFCWKLNKDLGANFRLSNENLVRLKKKTRDYYFNVFKWNDLATSTEHNLYNNKNDGEYLLPEFRNIDYLWLIKGDRIEEDYVNSIKNYAAQIEGIQFVVELTNEKIKNKGHLIL